MKLVSKVRFFFDWWMV